MFFGFFALLSVGILGLLIGFFIMFKWLDRSNNFGDSKATAEEVSLGGFIMHNKLDRLKYIPRLDDITNPNYLGPGLEDSVQKKDKMTLEKEIESSDLSGIKWHN